MTRVLPPSGPLRRLALGTIANGIGNGAWFTTWAIFLTREVGLSAAQVGLGMTATGALAIFAATPIGRLADRAGPRVVFATLLAAQAVAAAGWLLVGSLPGLLVVAGLAALAGNGSGGARNALVVGLAGPEERPVALGTLRSLSHVGWGMGAGLGAVVLALGTAPAFHAAVVLNALTYLGYAALVLSVPRVPPVPADPARVRGGALRDLPYVTLAGLVGSLALCWTMLSTALPLWLTSHTDAPVALSGVVVVASCLGIALFQRPVAARVSSPRAAARTAACAGGALAASCVLLAATDGGGGSLVVAMVLIAAGLHIAGELLFVSSSWGLSIPLMPAGATGEYQGVFAAGEAAATTLGPALMTTLVAGLGQPGWLVLAALFAVSGAATLPAARWALRTRRVAVVSRPAC